LSEIVIRCAVVYASLILLLRFFGKRELGQYSHVDLILMLILSNAVQNAMVGADTSLRGGLSAAATLVALHFLVTRLLSRFPRLRRLFEGTPTVLVRDGRVDWHAMRRERLEPGDLHSALRAHGDARLAEVSLAVLELDGSISVLTASAEARPTGARRRRER
jgi:uncharacterized membrane protein YcaP (DUF421 family)